MRWLRLGLIVGVCLAMAGSAAAQRMGGLTDLAGKSGLTEDDRQQIQTWLRSRIGNLVTTTDPQATEMIEARRAIVEMGRLDAGYSADFVQVYGREAVRLMSAARESAISPEARVNLVMAVAELRRLAGVSFLLEVLTTDDHAAARYLAAKGLDAVAPRVVEQGATRAEQAIAKGIQRAVSTETSSLTFYHLFQTLGQLDHQEAHNALALAVGRAAMAFPASDPTGSRAFEAAIRALERSYKNDVRPAGRQRTLMAYAFLCTWIGHDPPPADPDLMGKLHASLTELTGEEVEFSPGMDPLMQKLALLDWVEKLIETDRIPRRPALPPAVQRAVEAATGSP